MIRMRGVDQLFEPDYDQTYPPTRAQDGPK